MMGTLLILGLLAYIYFRNRTPDKVTRFSVGDRVTNGYRYYTITNIFQENGNYYYEMVDDNGLGAGIWAYQVDDDPTWNLES